MHVQFAAAWLLVGLTSVVVRPSASGSVQELNALRGLFTSIGGRQPVDLVLVMDRSHGMSKQTFYLSERKMAQAILMQYASLHTSYVRLAVITFAKTATVVIDAISNPDDTPNKCTLFGGEASLWENKVAYVDDPDQLKGTNMREAFEKAIEIFQKGARQRRQVQRVLLLLSDGKYSGDYDPINQAKELQETLHVEIYGIGTGNWLEDGNVRVVTSEKNGTYLYQNFTVWESLIKNDLGQLTSYSSDTPREWIQIYDCPCPKNSRCYCDLDRGILDCLCQPGFFHDDKNSVCEPCPFNTYKPLAGNDTECTPCPPRTFTEGNQSITQNACKCETGNNCTDPCENHSCNKRQRCVPVNDTAYSCRCLDGWEGPACSINPDACQTYGSRCKHGSQCLDGLGQSVFTCVCRDWGYRGRYCDFEENECVNQMCVNNGTCYDLRNNFNCTCVGDWIGRYCQDKRGSTTTVGSVTVTPALVVAADNTIWIIIGACVGGGLFIAIIIAVVAVSLSRRRKQKNKEEVKKVAQQFSGFWKKRTLRGSKYIKEMEEDAHAGLPSAPSAHRPDLIESTTNYENLKTDEYAELPYQTMTLKTGMESWQNYISELETSKVIEKAMITKLGGEKKALTTAWAFDPDEVSRLEQLMIQKDENVPLLLQEAEYHIQENDGVMAIGKTIGDAQKPRVVAVGKTKTYLVVAVAFAETDQGKVKKEVQWIVDHITGEGY